MSEFVLYNGAYSGPQVDAAVSRALSGGALDQEISALKSAVGSPLVAAMAAAMTDTSKVYVYTGTETGYVAGNWYYWNGSAWTSGGTYNAVAVDMALSGSSVNPVANKVIKDALDDQTSDLSDVRDLALGAYPTETESGPVAHTDAGADELPVKSLVVQITPYQSGYGTPAPDNVRPFSALTSARLWRYGSNLMPFGAEYTLKGASCVRDGCNLRVTTGADATYAGIAYYPVWLYVRPLAGRTFTLSCDIVIHSGKAAFGARYPWTRPTRPYDFVSGASVVAGTTGGHYSVTFTSLDEPVFLSFLCTYATEEAGDVEFNNVQLEIGSVESAAEVTVADALSTIQFGSAAGSVYGGTLDVLTGVLTVDRWRVVIDSTTPVYGIAQRTNTTRFSYYTPLAQNVVNPSELDLDAALCDRIPSVAYVYGNDILGLYVPTNHTPSAGGNDFMYISVPAAAGSTEDSVHAWLADNPLEIVYKLATPLTYQLTMAEIDSILGVNNVLAESGPVAVTFRCDPTLALDQIRNAILSLGNNT